MANVITNKNIESHNVDKYNFKVLAAANNEVEDELEPSIFEENHTKEDHPERRESDIDASSMSNSSKDSLIESLMKKTDDMSSNFIKLQMKLESMTEEHERELAELKENSYNQGVEDGKEEALADSQKSIAQGMEQFSSSVQTLETSAKEFDAALEGIKTELISAALDIAKEVITTELNDNSSEVAKVLSSELIKELQSASKITLKVNPKDHGTISEHVGSMEHIEVVSDSAVSVGGVIAISDAGNIDAEISKRFERVKRAALSE
ncbi:flagellar assembly protein FliH [Sulfurimonas sp.]|nr:flagellar assembly protein FliH [Sulfurimonas sp.]